jgi:hypothetical protein
MKMFIADVRFAKPKTKEEEKKNTPNYIRIRQKLFRQRREQSNPDSPGLSAGMRSEKDRLLEAGRLGFGNARLPHQQGNKEENQ